MRLISKLIVITLDSLKSPLEETAVLVSFPEFDDQIFAIALELKKRKITTYVLSGEMQLPSHWNEAKLKITLLKKHSLKSFIISKKAKYIFFTHGFIFSDVRRKKQQVINLWHGIPLKRIGESIGGNMPPSNFIITTSDYATSHIEQCYKNLSGIKIINSGLPRNCFLESVESPPMKISRMIWMPTYRDSKIGLNRSDGYSGTYGIGISEEQLYEFDSVCDLLSIRIDVLIHPMSEGRIPQELKNIKQLDRAEFNSGLYKSINSYDALISDYSSVIIDFLITNKPIFILALDYEIYRENRGFIFPLHEILGLPIAQTIKELKLQLDSPEELGVALKAAKNKWHKNVGINASSLIMDRVSAHSTL